MDSNETAYILGVDEAGRGPVAGHMVYATCICPIDQQKELKALGFADSKTLSEAQRDSLFEAIKSSQFLEYSVDAISPQTISAKMLRRDKVSLNALAHDSTALLIQQWLNQGKDIREAYIDTVGDPGHYQTKLSKQFPNIKITVAKKADSLYPIVSAASICAKVTRDHMLRDWQYTEEQAGIHVSSDMGSGYPADPVTKQWLEDAIDPVFGFPSVVRFSWSTAAKLMEEKCAPVVWGDEDESADTKGTLKMNAYFSASPAAGDASKSSTSGGLGSAAAAVLAPARQRYDTFARFHMHVPSAMMLS